MGKRGKACALKTVQGKKCQQWDPWTISKHFTSNFCPDSFLLYWIKTCHKGVLKKKSRIKEQWKEHYYIYSEHLNKGMFICELKGLHLSKIWIKTFQLNSLTKIFIKSNQSQCQENVFKVQKENDRFVATKVTRAIKSKSMNWAKRSLKAALK